MTDWGRVYRNLFGLQLACLLLLVDCVLQSSARAESCKHSSRHGYHRSFAGAKKWVKKFDDPARDTWQKPEEVIKALALVADDRVADIGAGTGYFSLRIAEAYPGIKVYALDVEPSMVNHLRARTKEKHLSNHIPVKVRGDKASLPGKVNKVLIVDTYHHIDNRIKYFKLLRTFLLPGARIVIIDFTAESPEGPPVQHRIPKSQLTDEMQEAGYFLIEDITLLPYQYFLTFRTGEEEESK